MASRSGKALVQNSEDIFRKCTAARSRSTRSSKEEEEEEGQILAELHLIVHVVNYERRPPRFYAFSSSCYDHDHEKYWSRQSNHLRLFPFPKASLGLRSSCNGLLYVDFSITGFSNGVGNKCAIWEPSTKTFQVIPRPSSMTRPCLCSSEDCCLDVLTDSSGIYFDSQSGDYKFISFTQNSYIYKHVDAPLFHHLSHHVQIYSVKNNLWKELTYPLTVKGKKGKLHEIIPYGMGVCVDGVCYWFASCKMDYSFILSFNFVTEEFSSFHQPKLERGYASFLVELDGSLGLLIHPKERTAEAGWKGVITLMVYSSSSSSSSWSRVDGFDEVPVVDVLQPLRFGKRNGTYSLLLKGSQGDLLEYDYTRKLFNLIHKIKLNPNENCRAIAYETKTKNNANIWHSSSFHALQVDKRFAVYASECDERGDD